MMKASLFIISCLAVFASSAWAEMGSERIPLGVFVPLTQAINDCIAQVANADRVVFTHVNGCKSRLRTQLANSYDCLANHKSLAKCFSNAKWE
jgi:hypothetical protein